jgi:hypothetical protein
MSGSFGASSKIVLREVTPPVPAPAEDTAEFRERGQALPLDTQSFVSSSQVVLREVTPPTPAPAAVSEDTAEFRGAFY